jgi:outer membrane protein assembly factor BamD
VGVKVIEGRIKAGHGTMKVRSILLWTVIFVGCVVWLGTAGGAWIWTRETGRFRNVNDIIKENARKQLEYAEGFEKQGDVKGALREYKKTVKAFPTAPEAATATFKIGVCYEKLEKPDAAFKAYQQVLEKYPSFSDPKEVIRRQLAIADEYYKGKRRPFPLLKVKLFKARGAAIEYFNKVVETAPYSELAADAKLSAAQLQQAKNLFDEAIGSYEFILEYYRKTKAAETAQFQIAICYYEKALRARYDEQAISLAKTHFNGYVEKYPEGEFVKEAREKLVALDEKKARGAFEVGQYYEKKKAFQSAVMYYTEVLQRHPLSSWAVKAEERIREMEGRGVLKQEESKKAS